MGQEKVTATIELETLADLMGLAVETFGRERATKWLRATNPKFAGKTPLEVYLASGSKPVEDELIAIQHGVVA
jgi:uncharacterized protein (DUF2384 family)